MTTDNFVLSQQQNHIYFCDISQIFSVYNNVLYATMSAWFLSISGACSAKQAFTLLAWLISLFSHRALTQDREKQPTAHLSKRSGGATLFKFLMTKEKKISAFCKTDKYYVQVSHELQKGKYCRLQKTKFFDIPKRIHVNLASTMSTIEITDFLGKITFPRNITFFFLTLVVS